MTVAHAGDLGAAASAASGTSLVITTTAAAAAGSLVVVAVACDNVSAATPTATVADSAGNTYTMRHWARGGGAGAAGGVFGGVATCKLGTALPSGGTITVTLSDAVVAKAALAAAFTGVDDSIRSPTTPVAYSATASGSVVTGSADVGDLVVAAGGVERDAGPSSYDSDTAGGAWSSGLSQVANPGGAAAGITVFTQWKVPTSGGTQSWDVGFGANRDFMLGAVVLAAAAAAATGAAALTGESTLTAAGHTTPSGSAALTAETAVTATGHAGPRGAAALTAETALTASGRTAPTGTASLTAQSTLTAAGRTEPTGAASLTGQSTLTAAGHTQPRGTAALTGESTLTATAAGPGPATGAASLTTTSTLTATGRTIARGAATLTASTTITAAGTTLARLSFRTPTGWRPVVAVHAKHPVDGWRQADHLHVKTRAGWRAVT